MKNITIKRDKEFYYGGCALLAVQRVFNIKAPDLLDLLKVESVWAFHVKYKEGFTWREVDNMLKLVAKAKHKGVIYKALHPKLHLDKLLPLLHHRGTYILNAPIHTSPIIKGVMKDDWYHEKIKDSKPLDDKFSGYWTIKPM